MASTIISRSLGTHDGTFHGDEVTACALLILTGRIDRDKIHRTRDPKILEQCEYVCDLGGIYDPSIKRFDHHQADYTGPMSSAGMVLRYLASEGDLTTQEFEVFRDSLIDGVDAHDNGQLPALPGCCTFSHVISNMTPISRNASQEEENEAFLKAVQFAIEHLQRVLQRIDYIESCKQKVSEAMEKFDDCMIFDDNIPWIENFFAIGGDTHPATFVVMPAGPHWKLRGVPPTFARRMEVREPLPLEWAGLLEGQLKEKTGIPGAIFCHKGRFISVWETKEDALNAYKVVSSMRQMK